MPLYSDVYNYYSLTLVLGDSGRRQFWKRVHWRQKSPGGFTLNPLPSFLNCFCSHASFLFNLFVLFLFLATLQTVINKAFHCLMVTFLFSKCCALLLGVLTIALFIYCCWGSCWSRLTGTCSDSRSTYTWTIVFTVTSEQAVHNRAAQWSQTIKWQASIQSLTK